MNNAEKAYSKGYRFIGWNVINTKTGNVRKLQTLTKGKPRFSFWYKDRVLNCYVNDLINLNKAGTVDTLEQINKILIEAAVPANCGKL